MDEVIVIKRATQSDKPNVNGYIYTKEAFTNAMDEVFNNGGSFPYCIVGPKYYEFRKRVDLINNNCVGKVIGYDDNTVAVKLNGNHKEIVDKYLIPYLDKLDAKMRYIADLDNNPISKMSIYMFDTIIQYNI